MDAPGGSEGHEAAMAKAEADWQSKVAQAANMARQAGNIPGGLKKFIDDTLNPKADWADILKEFVVQSAKDEYRMLPPNRRYVWQGQYLPTLTSDSLPPIVLYVDTSGSTWSYLDQFLAEMSSIVEDANPEALHVVYVDTRVARTETLTADDMPLKVEFSGGGGTDFRPGFEWVEDEGLTPVCAIYLTDLECSSYPDEPAYPVLWVAPEASHYGGEPPFGEVIYMDQ